MPTSSQRSESGDTRFAQKSSRPAAPECSVVILAFNEERNISLVLQSLAGFTDVHVLDSGSNDATVSIARSLGAQVWHNPFQSFAQQRNWAHDQISLKHRWVLHLDADERMNETLADEISLAIRGDDGKSAGYYLAEKTMLRGQWLRHAGQYPRYQARLVHVDRMRFVDHGHGQRESSDLPFGTLHQPYEHHAFSHGLAHWLKKHAVYAAQEAKQIDAGSDEDRPGFSDLLMGSAFSRRRALKYYGMQVPFRPALRWFFVLFVSRGIMDGAAGLEYARMMRLFQEMIDLCLRDLRRKQA